MVSKSKKMILQIFVNNMFSCIYFMILFVGNWIVLESLATFVNTPYGTTYAALSIISV